MRRRPAEPLDVELADLPPEQRWRVWMGRVEAVIFAAATPVDRASLARLVGQSCNLDLIIADIRRELGGRPYELVAVAGGWQFRTRAAYAPVLQAALGVDDQARSLSRGETLVLTAIAYLQPVTRGELGRLIGREVSRDTIGYLKAIGHIAAGPRSPEPGAPYTYVTTAHFLSTFGFASLRELPDIEALEDAGLLGGGRRPAPPLGFETVTDDPDDSAD